MRCLSRLLVSACLALSLASVGLARETSASIRLVAPRAGAALVAGSMAELEWAPAEPFADLSQIEEWEAFLSVDGGATYPVRITPHLDQDLRRIRFQVPFVPTADARILLRFGDERRETGVELPERFVIEASPVQTFLPIHQAATAGEPALPGQSGVVAWVEGSRRGGSLRQVVAPETSGWHGSRPRPLRMGPPCSSPSRNLPAPRTPCQRSARPRRRPPATARRGRRLGPDRLSPPTSSSSPSGRTNKPGCHPPDEVAAIRGGPIVQFP